MKQTFYILLLLLGFLPMFGQKYMPGELIVDLSHNQSIDRLLGEKIDVSIIKCLSKSWNIWLIKVPVNQELEYINQLQGNKIVEQVQLNHITTKRNTPNDSLYYEQWGFNNTGQGIGTIGADIDAEAAWDLDTGGGLTVLGDTIVVAVIDGGIDLDHIDLDLWKNHNEIPNNNIDDDVNGYIDDYDGWNAAFSNGNITVDAHGTHVAGTVGARGNNLVGVTGVNWQVKIMPLQLFDYDEAEIVEAYTYVFDMRKLYHSTLGQKGAFIVATNASFGVNFADPADFPIWCAIYDSLGTYGILNAGATNNSQVDVDAVGDMPTTCASDFLIAVTSTSSQDNLAGTGYGLTHIDLGAPGTAIFSTRPGDVYGYSTGTSMATPHVAGAIALLFSAACPELMQAYYDYPDSIARLLKSFILTGTEPKPTLQGKSVSGGRLNIYNTLNLMFTNGCPTCLEVNLDINSISCYGEADGSAEVFINSGVPPYMVEWSNGDSVLAIDSLGEQKMFVNVTDSTGCGYFGIVNIFEPEELTVTFTIGDTPADVNEGYILTTVSGGTEPYHYQWEDFNNSNDRSNLADGTYYLTLTDANGCEVIDSAVVPLYISVGTINNDAHLILYPNPTTGIVYFEGLNETAADCMIFDNTGRLLQQNKLDATRNNIDIAHLPAGIYYIQIVANEFSTTRKIIRY